MLSWALAHRLWPSCQPSRAWVKHLSHTRHERQASAKWGVGTTVLAAVGAVGIGAVVADTVGAAVAVVVVVLVVVALWLPLSRGCR